MLGKETASPIARTVLREQIKRYLLDAIRAGRLKGGDRVVETQMARQLGVSQAPVREAIRELEQMGVLESQPFHGAVVKQLTPGELHDIYAVRAVLEAMAARVAAVRLTDEELEELRVMVEEMTAAARARDVERMVEINIAFHERIVRAAGNGFLVKLWHLMQPPYWTALTTSLSRRGLEELATRHQAVVDALASRDPQRAAVTMEAHIAELADEVAEQSRGQG